MIVFIYLSRIELIYMNISKYFTVILLLLFNFSEDVFAQPGVVHEVGVIGGPLQFRSDYGERGNSETNSNNKGYGLGIIDYMNFAYNASPRDYFPNHFKVRNELSYSKTNLQNYGQWIEKNTIGAKQLAAMRGSTQLINLGSQLEYYPLTDLHEYEYDIGSFAPYVAVGLQVTYYSAIATSTLGPMGTAGVTFPKYLIPSDGRPHGYSTESKAAFSGVMNIGTRYRLGTLSDLVLDLRYQYFASDWVDGLNPNKDQFSENRSNDSLIWLTVGYIFYLDN